MRQVLKKLTRLLVLAGAVAATGCGGSNGAGNNGGNNVNAAISLQPAFPSLPKLTRPVALLQPPTDSSVWYTIEQPGQVRRFANTAEADAFDLVLDISERVSSTANEAGLLGMAFHPDYSSNGRVFLSYTRSANPLVSVISEFAQNPDGLTLDPDSERIVLQVNQDRNNHNGGQIGFGPDTYLYIGLGDGGSSINRAQDLTSLPGSILRINVNGATPYTIPGDNPHAGNPLCAADHSSITACPELYAWGLRNPWRWSFDNNTGMLWAGDVGERTTEEINVIELGNDYGWRTREGSACFSDAACDSINLTDPVVEYSHSEGRSVTGGYVYRGTMLGDQIGNYIFGDFATGLIWAYDPAKGTRTPLLESTAAIASFAQGNDNELYVVDLLRGRFLRLQSAN